MLSSALRVTFGIDPAQRVVGAEFDDHRLGAVGGTDQSSRPSPPDAVSPDTPGIDDSDGDALGLQRAWKLGREGLRGRQAVAGGQRVAQRHHFDRPVAPRLRR